MTGQTDDTRADDTRADSTRTDSPRGDLRDALVQLGFSAYEARCYVGLVGTRGLTGYGVAKETGVPQPKVYETLRKLVRRGAVTQIADNPAVFAATAPDTLLASIEQEFRSQHTAAATAATAIEHLAPAGTAVALPAFASRSDVVDAAQALVRVAARRIYLSASTEEIDDLLPALRDAVGRGVHVILLDFGRSVRDEPGMRVFRHSSTEHAIYRHHQARHLALIADSRDALSAIAPAGDDWSGVRTDHPAVVAAVKGMIRHDIDMQQVYADFGAQLVDAYGPGLQALEAYRVPADDRAVAAESSSESEAGRRRPA